MIQVTNTDGNFEILKDDSRKIDLIPGTPVSGNSERFPNETDRDMANHVNQKIRVFNEQENLDGSHITTVVENGLTRNPIQKVLTFFTQNCGVL